nr:MAG TPA: hypothetical protein [Caudoviricetes sp.]
MPSVLSSKDKAYETIYIIACESVQCNSRASCY